jgi:hypothetical protein
MGSGPWIRRTRCSCWHSASYRSRSWRRCSCRACCGSSSPTSDTIAPVTIIAVDIRKQALADRYAQPSNPYHLALSYGLERVCRLLKERGQQGRRTHVVCERRGDRLARPSPDPAQSRVRHPVSTPAAQPDRRSGRMGTQDVPRLKAERPRGIPRSQTPTGHSQSICRNHSANRTCGQVSLPPAGDAGIASARRGDKMMAPRPSLRRSAPAPAPAPRACRPPGARDSTWHPRGTRRHAAPRCPGNRGPRRCRTRSRASSVRSR